ncbi:MAG: S-adenosylmethionine tRNA ribosyltransferase [Bacteroidetes bacterium 24-39-8]|jgi:S-adenosylmethionine:tRNA ribosyltransferase-isomerase|nr:MAG: S-adenosylmethionine tRNA ribosyltransferase [Sphingobacteriia bacterium 35-40-8]OYZ52272.1 MAG: S-adenosylmethionine tRNA ribosyltransferase [Bacteroidetes bacterium 24-39-8]OZA63967.1 MAG: S-adenosylmethionine tRNA ribosyltransferase [Sphingobacteriia bacterium 39-39-8]HQR92053.1 S-adenosylmethionine:tRNA ribosyltransferase-isomerase [Sediminibacterium sp.]HQS54682.1 S-adenosylmethionine:tRNA ribosyltransferase-isomerase [Sediminibacterium sp.]
MLAEQVKKIQIKDYSYELPDERIAKFPLDNRDQSKLLIANQPYQIDQYLNLAQHLPANSFLVFNNTKVVEARILFQKPTGGVIELFCLEPDESYADITTAMLQKGTVQWKCLVGGAKKWKEEFLEKTIIDQGQTITLRARRVAQGAEAYLIEFSWSNEQMSFAELLHIAGLIPLPPYLNRQAENSDAERYQTVYAKHDGSVAAPTAGLHFTEGVFASLASKGIQKDFVTLHVGAGTFKPVKADAMQDHEMHAEFIDVSISFIENLLSRLGDPIVPVGTTSMRTLESLYWLGGKTISNPSISLAELAVYQWDPYERNEVIPASIALASLLQWMKALQLIRLITKTQIIIAPGYQFRICSGLITNFHQPQSTLLLLVSALIGDKWKDLYDHAMKNDFRFLSYGDGCLIWNVS